MTSVPDHVHSVPREAETPATGNLVELILRHARQTPHEVALVESSVAITYGELAERIAMRAAGIRAARIPVGARVVLLAPPDADLYVLALALLATGRTLVFVEGRRGVRALLRAVAEAQPDVIVAPRALLSMWPFVPALRQARRIGVRGALCGRQSRPAGAPSRLPRCTAVNPATPAIVSFSSGNSGRAKAVVRSHAVLLAQHRALAAALPVGARDLNLPGFPMAAIHNLCCGTATVLPGGDLRAMADADPAAVLALIERQHVTSVCGAPAFLSRLAAATISRGTPATGVRHVAVGGGPVGRALAANLLRAFPRATAHVVYGATEAEPIATATLTELLAADDDEGFLVGSPAPGTRVQLESSTGERGITGEIAVRGAQVAGVSGIEWHHTGDVGRLDARGRLWLLGRVGAEVVHRGRVVHPYVAEAAALAVPGVRVAALVAHTRAPEGELSVELEPGANHGTVITAVRDALLARGLGALDVCVRRDIPLDVRHASKVSRRALVDSIERGNR